MKTALWGTALLAGALLLSGAPRAQDNPADRGFPYGDLKEVTLQGKLISLGDAMARKYGARLTGAGPEKQWAFALPEGQLYTFLDNEAYRKLLAATKADAPVEVRARHFPRSMLLEVLTFRPVAAETVRRRFHCSVCNISTEDWGPCACCGREMEPVREKS
jgi:hypothetical protein